MIYGMDSGNLCGGDLELGGGEMQLAACQHMETGLHTSALYDDYMDGNTSFGRSGGDSG